MSGRKERKKREERGKISTDSFADIAFLLIVFFIIATTMLKVHGLNTDLPAGEQSKQQQSDEKQPVVLVYPDEIKYNEGAVTIDELRLKLAELELYDKKDENDRVVQLEAVDEPAWESYMLVWGAIVKAGGMVAMVEGAEEDE